MSDKVRNYLLVGLMCVFIALAIWTLLPGDASKPNDLGYFSVCSFAPWSSLALLLVAGVLWVVRRYFQTRPQLQRLD
jgi:hypothetical protein